MAWAVYVYCVRHRHGGMLFCGRWRGCGEREARRGGEAFPQNNDGLPDYFARACFFVVAIMTFYRNKRSRTLSFDCEVLDAQTHSLSLLHPKQSDMTTHPAHKAAPKHSLLQLILNLLPFALVSAQAASFVPHNNPYEPPPSPSNSIQHTTDRVQSNPRSEVKMRAWTCHGRTQKEMVDKLASVS